MKIHKIEILIVDMDDVGASEITDIIENTKYPNHCISPQVKKIITKEIEWSDSHPLNMHSTAEAEYNRIFKENE